MNSVFPGRSGIVTGASSGLGRQIAQTLGTAGMELWLVGRSAAELELTAANIEENGGPEAHCVPMDLSERGVLAALIEEVGKRHPHLFALVNNAGVMYPEPTIEADPERSHEMFAINVLTPMEACRAAVRVMRRQGSPGHLINISSLAGRNDRYGAYSVSKAALNQLGRVLRRELENDDIRVTTIIPGGFATQLGRGFSEASMARFATAIAAVGFDPEGADAQRVLGDPQHVADVIRYVLEQPIDLNLEEITIRPAFSLDV
jgi:NAD(P)-dependent dehydrogenase (short-subunit alcohol dehydrogenase family)